jgi:hypothetical protein
MTLWSRSDLAAVTVSVDAHGGCGRTHSRPVNGDKPVTVWQLDCPQCEDHLRHDPHWAVTPSEVPETWDESKSREDFERRGAKDKDAVLTLALARLAGIDSSELPESLTRMISGAPLHVPVAGKMVCPAGHDSPAGMKFCGQCGAPMSGTVAKAALDAPQWAAEPPAAEPTLHQGGRPFRLQDLRHDELQAACRARGLDSEGVRKVLMKRLRTAGVTNADLQQLLVAA